MSRVIVAVAAMMMILAPAFSWELSFGTEPGKVGIKAPVGAEDFPVGPASFRVVGDNLWVLDSANGKVLCFDSSSKLIKEVAIPSLPKEWVLDDFALQFSAGSTEPVAIIVVDLMERLVIKFGMDGKELLKIKPDNLIQLDEIQIDSNGQFYVGDYANRVIGVFAPDGKQLHQISWQCSGFVIDHENNLHIIHYDEKAGHFHVKLNNGGTTEMARAELGLPEMQNPRIWHVNAKGEYLVSFIPPAGETNSQVLYTYSSAGEILKRVNFNSPYYIKRYLSAGNESAWLVDAEYGKAPGQSIKFKQL